MLLAIRVPLKHFFLKLLWLGGNGPENGPKCPFSLFLGIIFGAFAKTIFKKLQSFTMGHGLKEEMEMEIPRPKTKTPGNSILFFLGHPWKFHYVFN